MICENCGREFVGIVCPYCDINKEEPKEVEVVQMAVEEEKQSGFGIAAFVLAVVAFALCVSKHSISGWLSPVIISFLQMWQNILCIIAFIFGTIGMLTKNRKSGFATAGNIISFILFWI